VIYGKQFVRCTLENWGMPRLSLSVGVQNGDTFSIAKPLTLEAIKDPCASFEPTVVLSRDAAQELIDELWRCGLRPSEGSGSAGALAATERHLADMRALSFGKLGIKAPEGR
jgi:hypothetical protein